MNGLYADHAADAISRPLTHLYRVTAYPIDGAPFPIAVDGDGLQVTFSEDWSPYVQATIKSVVPFNAAQLDALDARKLCRLTIEAGYRYLDLTEDLQPLADLMLNDRQVRRPGNTMDLDASSDETRAQDRKRTDRSEVPVFTGVNGVIGWAAGWAMYPETPVLSTTVGSTFGADRIKDLDLEIGSDWWSLIADVANRCGLWVFSDETRKWKIRTRADVDTPTLHLTVGQGGTILLSDSGLNRDDWANYVIIQYKFTQKKPTTEDPKATVDKTIYGRARVTSGPFSVDSVGYKMHYETREVGVDQAAANHAAESVLKNLSTRGRSLSLEAAAAYWLRPGHTITVQLVTGAVQTVLVSSVAFNPVRGVMSIKTRYPETGTITQGE